MLLLLLLLLLYVAELRGRVSTPLHKLDESSPSYSSSFLNM
jgi:hypothetical protein